MRRAKSKMLNVRFSSADYEMVKRASRSERLSYSNFVARSAVKAAQGILALLRKTELEQAVSAD